MPAPRYYLVARHLIREVVAAKSRASPEEDIESDDAKTNVSQQRRLKIYLYH